MSVGHYCPITFSFDELHELSKLADLWVKNAILRSLYFDTQRSHIALFIDKKIPSYSRCFFPPGSAAMCPGV